MEDHGKQPNNAPLYASPLLTPTLTTALERRVLELEKRDAAQQELIEALARGFMGLIEAGQAQQTQLEKLIDVCTKQQVLIDGLDRHLEMHGNALESHGKVLARVEADYEDDDASPLDAFLAHALTFAGPLVRSPRRPR